MNFRGYTRSYYHKQFQPKIHQIAFGGHLRPGPLDRAYSDPRPNSWGSKIKGNLLLREGDGKEMEGEDRGEVKGKGSECPGRKGEKEK